MQEYLYRFRSIDSLLKFKELENQEIYFASPEELNDPMEGYKDIFWTGDEIIWKNFLKHYLLCLENVCALLIIGGEDYEIKNEHISIFRTLDDLPTQQYKNLYREICLLFFKNSKMKNYPKGFASRKNPIRSDELNLHFKIIHFSALDSIFTVLNKHKLLSNLPKNNPLRNFSNLPMKDDLFKLTNIVEKQHSDLNSEILFNVVNNVFNQTELIHLYNNPNFLGSKNRRFVLLDFPKIYIKQLEKLVHPEWYAACFLNDYTNASMWGYYGYNHTGVCLKFKTLSVQQQSGKLFSLYGITGWQGNQDEIKPIYSFTNHQFYKVDYNSKYPEIDFFKNIGRLPIPILKKYWYMDENNNISICADDIFNNEENWRKTYWDNFTKGISIKLNDWLHENEYRLIIYSLLGDEYDTCEKRKLKYNFFDIEGIIFGIKTPIEDKLKIMKIIENKCQKENRTDFKFYQAYYSRDTGKIEANEMSLLKVKLDSKLDR